MLISTSRLILLSAVFLSLSANWRFMSAAAEAFPPGHGNVLFLLSLPLVHASVLVLLLVMVGSRFLLRPVLTVLFLLAAPAAYFSDRFGAVIDETMILNVLQTDPAEVRDLLTLEWLARIVLLGLVPVFLLWRAKIERRPLRVEWRSRLWLGTGALATAVVAILLFGSSYASFFREFKPIRYYANPTYPLYSLGRFVAGTQNPAAPTHVRPVDAQAHLPAVDHDRELMILVIGETVRADHFSLNGYVRETNPVLSSVPGVYSYASVTACGTSTAVSVPCIFSRSRHDDFDVTEAPEEENVLDVLQRVGVSVLWRDNNSSSKGVATRVEYQDFKDARLNPVCDDECRDVGMLAGLQEYLDEQDGDVLVVLHQMGNHGPAYYRRYPKEFEFFQPVCKTAKLSECTDEEVINAYDNAVRYTDWFLGEVIGFLRKNEARYETMMLYVSDHGESLGEYGVYLHGAPYAFAPDAQVSVPLVVWQGAHNDIDEESLKLKQYRPTSHDSIYPTLLDFFEVQDAGTDPVTELFTRDDD
ncbi:MAG: phosphoethanolamine--lipid A transferase [Alcanivoracaceae bacterium]|nr:phosphoethanolamine--lipid A transferase [Alcanivoracaceae bacterium]